MTLPPLHVNIGDRVIRRGGYNFRGYVVSSFKTLSNRDRTVVESEEIPGLLMIYNPEQLEKL